MLDFFTSVLSPVFIVLGLLNPIPEVLEEQPYIEKPSEQIEVIDQEIKLEEESNVAGQEKIEVISEEQEISVGINTSKAINNTATFIEQEYIPWEPPEELKEDINEEAKQEEFLTSEPENIDLEAKCGTAEEQVFGSDQPEENLCETGVASEITIYKEDSYRWNCNMEDDKDRCKATRSVNGQCGEIANSGLILKENYDEDTLCNEGEIAQLNENNGVLTYFCNGTTESSLNAKCEVLLEVDGRCNYISDYTISNISDDNTCGSGLKSNLTSEIIRKDNETVYTEYKYVCQGFNGGSDSKECEVKSKTRKVETCLSPPPIGTIPVACS
jgi:hypothetical protein